MKTHILPTMNNNYRSFNGLGTALVTPFLTDGSVDYETLRKLIRCQIDNGTDFLCVLGTTAETPTLTIEERNRIISIAIEENAGRVPVMVGCGGNCTPAVIEAMKQLPKDGIDAILSVVPFYNKPSQEGIFRHFEAIANATDKPIILYNVPGRTGVNMTAETTLRIARSFPMVKGIKEASGKMDQIKEIIDGKPEGFQVISGDDSLAMDSIKMGACGVISVIANAIPAEYGELIHSTMKGELAKAEELQARFNPVYGLLFKEGNPCGVKAAMSVRGMLQNVCRLPMVPVSDALMEEIKAGFAGI